MVQVTNTLQGMSPNHHAQVLIRDFGPSIKGKEASSRKPCKGQHVDIQTVIWIHAQVVVGTAEHKPQNVFAVDCFFIRSSGFVVSSFPFSDMRASCLRLSALLFPRIQNGCCFFLPTSAPWYPL